MFIKAYEGYINLDMVEIVKPEKIDVDKWVIMLYTKDSKNYTTAYKLDDIYKTKEDAEKAMGEFMDGVNMLSCNFSNLKHML